MLACDKAENAFLMAKMCLKLHNFSVQYSLGCSAKRLFLSYVLVSGYMVRLGEWSPQKKFSVIDP